jgi:hypothetical protein
LNTYIVQPRDTLSAIANTVLGNANHWPEIAKLNALSNPNRLFIGQRLKLPTSGSVTANQPSVTKPQTGPSVLFGTQIPAGVALARGFMFVIFEQLPHVGATSVIRKVAAVPKNFALAPKNLFGNLSVAEHALGMNPAGSPFLSASNMPFGAPSIGGEPLLLDIAKIKQAGGQIYSVQEVVKDLQRFVAENPLASHRVNTLIRTIQGVEGEILIKGATPAGSATTLSAPHLNYVRSAEDLWKSFNVGKLTRPQLEAELVQLQRAYSRARIVGNVGRGLMVFGVILTVVDLGHAANRSVQQHSFKPIGAEVIRQAGGWGMAAAGTKLGFGVGALFGIETGPGAIVTGAIGAIIFGAAGYIGADWIADKISPN